MYMIKLRLVNVICNLEYIFLLLCLNDIKKYQILFGKYKKSWHLFNVMLYNCNWHQFNPDSFSENIVAFYFIQFSWSCCKLHKHLFTHALLHNIKECFFKCKVIRKQFWDSTECRHYIRHCECVVVSVCTNTMYIFCNTGDLTGKIWWYCWMEKKCVY